MIVTSKSVVSSQLQVQKLSSENTNRNEKQVIIDSVSSAEKIGDKEGLMQSFKIQKRSGK